LKEQLETRFKIFSFNPLSLDPIADPFSCLSKCGELEKSISKLLINIVLVLLIEIHITVIDL